MGYPDLTVGLPLSPCMQEGSSERATCAVQGAEGLGQSHAEPVCRSVPDATELEATGQYTAAAASGDHTVLCF